MGMVIEEIEGWVTVVAPMRGSPAEEAGIRPRDRIVAVDGEPVVGKPVEKVTYLVRGEPDTTVNLTVMREGEEHYLQITIVREEIVIPTVEPRLLPDDVGYITVANFARETPDLVEEAVRDLLSEGADSLILDLRRNAGGYLAAAIRVADLFLRPGVAILDIYDRHGAVGSHISTVDPITEVPLVVLVDGGSASASEAVAAALRQGGRATIVGDRTFGKGTIQTTLPLPSGGVLRFTAAEFRAARGGPVESRGVLAHMLIPHPEAQLPRALMHLGPGVTQRVRLREDSNFLHCNGDPVHLQQPGVIRDNGVYYVSVRDVVGVFGYPVLWDEDAHRIAVLDGERRVELCPGRGNVWVDGVLQPDTYSVFTRKGRAYACADFLWDFLGLIAERDPGERWVELIK